MSNWNDIVFNGRNKSYGAYELRQKYYIGLLIAIGVVLQLVLIFVAVSLFPTIENSNQDEPISIVTSYIPPPPKNKPEESILPELKKIRKQDAFVPPKIVDAEVLPDKSLPDNSLVNDNMPENNGVAENGSNYGVLDGEGTSDDAIYVIVEEMPKFPGGNKALSQFLQRNIKYPKLAQDHKIQGTLYVSFIIRKDGSVSEARVIQGLGMGCDEEAIRVVNMMPKWSPGRRKGVSVNIILQMPIKFVLPVKSQ